MAPPPPPVVAQSAASPPRSATLLGELRALRALAGSPTSPRRDGRQRSPASSIFDGGRLEADAPLSHREERVNGGRPEADTSLSHIEERVNGGRPEAATPLSHVEERVDGCRPEADTPLSHAERVSARALVEELLGTPGPSTPTPRLTLWPSTPTATASCHETGSPVGATQDLLDSVVASKPTAAADVRDVLRDESQRSAAGVLGERCVWSVIAELFVQLLRRPKTCAPSRRERALELHRHGLAANRRGAFAEAREHFEEAYLTWPRASMLVSCANMLLKEGKGEAACALYDALLALPAAALRAPPNGVGSAGHAHRLSSRWLCTSMSNSSSVLGSGGLFEEQVESSPVQSSPVQFSPVQSRRRWADEGPRQWARGGGGGGGGGMWADVARA